MRWVLLASASLVGDRAVPARHRDARTPSCSPQLRQAARAERRAGQRADADRAWQLWRLRRGLKRGVFGSRLAAAARAAVRAGRRAAGRARLRGVGAVPRPLDRELVRRARRSRARGRPRTSGAVALDYLLQDDDEQGATQIAARSPNREAPPVPIALIARSRAGRRRTRRRCTPPRAASSRSAASAQSTATPEPPPAQALRRARLQQTTPR